MSFVRLALSLLDLLHSHLPSGLYNRTNVLEVSVILHYPILSFLIGGSLRFGYQNTSAIDTLLDKDEISLEAILDEEELLQECKSQNTRLIDYLQRRDVLQRLFGYVIGTIEGEGEAKYKYVVSAYSEK